MRNFRWIGIFVVSVLMGCSQGFQAAQNASTGESGAGTGADVPSNPGNNSGTPPATPPELTICSKLDFTGVDWPKALVASDRKALALSLNITGSFEGSAGWANLGNNFDGQGMSLGLSQQNLGQGTLQPLLQSMVTKEGPLLQALFSPANLSSMTSMLKPWATSAASLDAMVVENPFDNYSAEANLFPDKSALNVLDAGYEPNNISALDARTTASVSWAKSTIYQSGGSVFKSDWKNSFLSLAVTAPYRSLQIQAAMNMFTKAAGYFDSLRFTELRSLLMMYDIVVQNGGLNSTHLSQFRSFVASNPNASETSRLAKLVEIRVVSVLDKYKNDVRARKMTIVNGTGTVHGAKRDLQKEYCFTSSEVIP